MDFFRRVKAQMSEMLARGSVSCCSFFLLMITQSLISLNPFSKRDNVSESKIRQMQGVLDNLGKNIEEIQKMNKRINLQLDILDAQVGDLSRFNKERMDTTGGVPDRTTVVSGCSVSSFKDIGYQVPRSLAVKDQSDCMMPLMSESERSQTEEQYECMVYRSIESVKD